MSYSITSEYTALLQDKAKVKSELTTLPRGYISKKTIGGKEYHYLQTRVNRKVISTYIKANELSDVKNKLSLRQAYLKKLPRITHRLSEIEQASKTLDAKLYRKLMMLKISIGMDNMSDNQKSKSISFAEAMTAIEGVPVSDQAKDAVIEWKNGNNSFLSVYELTLKRYGFPVEV